MPPKPVAKKAPAKGATAAKTGAKPAAKGGATGGSKAAPAKTEAKKADPPAPVKKVLVPEEIGLKEIAGVIQLGGDVGGKVKESKRWMYLIDRNGNVGTFLKYRDVNMVSATDAYSFEVEPLRKALLGSFKFGKTCILDISDADQGKILDVAAEKYNKMYPGCWNDLMDRSILENEKYHELYKANDDDDYKNPLDYRIADFQFVILTNMDPPSTVMENYFPIIIN